MLRKINILVICLLVHSVSIASTLDSYTSSDLLITPYTVGGQNRASFFYRLDQNVSNAFGQVVSGWLVLDVAQSYDLTNDYHEIRIHYTDLDNPELITDQLWNDFSDEPVTQSTWYITTDALLNGQAEYHITEYPDSVQSGDLMFSIDGNPLANGAPFICIECGLDVFVNLLYMDFSSGSLELDFSATDLTMLDGQAYFSGQAPYFFDMHLTAAPIPVPAAFWLLGSALLVTWRRLR